MSQKQNKQAQQLNRIKTLSELVSRAELATKLGVQYSDSRTSRDIYQALGYPDEPTYQDFATRYERQDIARAVIDKPVDASWQGGCFVQESTEEDTALEKAWKNLIRHENLDVFGSLNHLDKLAGIGEYAVLLFGLADVSTKEIFAQPAPKNTELIYFRSLGQNHAEISEWERDSSNPRYGLPVMYDVTLVSPDSDSETVLRVHHSRVLHVAGEVLEGLVIGSSRLLPIYNRLMDIEKLVGGSAEMFWRGARPGYEGKLDENYTMTTSDKDDLQDQLDEYEHNLRRFLITSGIDIHPLQLQVSDPSSHVDIQIQMIAAQTGIPKRILTGSERGELSSTQDITSWYALLQARRENYINGTILRPFIWKCQEFGVLPPVQNEEKGYQLIWNPLFEKSEKEKAEVGEIRAKALNQYASQPMAESIVPPEAFHRYFLGFDDAQIEMMKELQEAAISEEEGE